MKNLSVYIKSILVPVLVGGIVGIIISNYMDYTLLIRPNFAPPAIVFPIAWTILYILMGISYAILKTNGLTDDKITTIYYSQLFVNALWPIFFFVFNWRLFSFLWILLLIILVFLMIKEFYKKNKIAGLLQIPYLIWIIFASILNLSVYLLN